jgi:hypothetical protein
LGIWLFLKSFSILKLLSFFEFFKFQTGLLILLSFGLTREKQKSLKKSFICFIVTKQNRRGSKF